MEEKESEKMPVEEASIAQVSLSKDDEACATDSHPESFNASDSLADASEPSDSKGNGKKTKKSKHVWKNRFSKQKQKCSTSQDTSENNLNRRHLNFKFRAGRKRTQTFPAGSKFFLPYKRPRKETFIPPTKFLLGGNISDPLNLNSLQDEDINRAMNAITPKSSPLPTPPRHKAKYEVLYPPDLRDPLHLMQPVDNAEYEKQLEIKKPRRARKRGKSKRRSMESANVPASSPTQASPVKEESSAPTDTPVEAPQASTPEPSTSTAPKDLKLDLSHIRGHKRTASESEGSAKGKDGKKSRRMDFLDKIVSPVIPQPGAWMRVHPRGGGHAGRGGGHAGRGGGHAGRGGGHTGRGGHQAKTRAGLSRANFTSNVKTNTAPLPLPKFRKQDTRYQFGNYDRYYGYRNLDAMIDIRLKVFGLNRHLFNNKDVLDIGCNVGHISIAVAKDLGAKSVTGIDIDKNLIARARKNVKDYVLVPPPGNTPPRVDQAEAMEQSDDVFTDKSVGEKLDSTAEHPESSSALMEESVAGISTGDINAKGHAHNRHKKFKRNRRSHHKHAQDLPKCHFPISCPILYGPVQVVGYSLDGQPPTFPQNLVFKQANYILRDENLIMADPSQYDLILCLSVTKWFHLNWGDAGLKLAFKRMFSQLRPGGKLILEAQNWASYKKKKKLTETIYKNFMGIEFFPNKFREYLLSPEVGFSKCCVLGVPQHLSKGFRRPIHLYIKGDFTPSKVQWSDTYAPSSHHQTDLNIENQPKKVYVNSFSPSYNPSNNFWGGTPLYGAATPYSPCLESNTTEESPFYNPRSDSYLPSYTSSGQTKTVYASLSSPQSDYGGTPNHVSEGVINQTSQGGVYATMMSPASPFLEPSPGNSGTPSHPFTPSHSASCEPPSRKVYASLHSPQEEGRGQPVYSPSVACAGRRGASPLHTGPLLDHDNTSSSDSLQAKSLTPATSPAQDLADSRQSPKEPNNDSEQG